MALRRLRAVPDARLRPGAGRRQRQLRHRLYPHRPVSGPRRHLVPTSHRRAARCRRTAPSFRTRQRPTGPQTRPDQPHCGVGGPRGRDGSADRAYEGRAAPCVLRNEASPRGFRGPHAGRSPAGASRRLRLLRGDRSFGEGVRAFLEMRKSSIPGRQAIPTADRSFAVFNARCHGHRITQRVSVIRRGGDAHVVSVRGQLARTEWANELEAHQPAQCRAKKATQWTRHD